MLKAGKKQLLLNNCDTIVQMNAGEQSILSDIETNRRGGDRLLKKANKPSGNCGKKYTITVEKCA